MTTTTATATTTADAQITNGTPKQNAYARKLRARLLTIIERDIAYCQHQAKYAAEPAWLLARAEGRAKILEAAKAEANARFWLDYLANDRYDECIVELAKRAGVDIDIDERD